MEQELIQQFNNPAQMQRLKQYKLENYKKLCRMALKLLKEEELWIFAIEIIKQNSLQRIQEEVEVLIQVTQSLKFFKQINERVRNSQEMVHFKICQKMYYETFQEGEIIFKVGALPNKFYILLQGKVNIYLPKDLGQIQSEIQQESTVEESISILKKGYTAIQNIQELEELTNLNPLLLTELDFLFYKNVFKHKFIVSLTQGNMFGELGILMNKPRSATAIAAEQVHLGVLNAQAYRNLLMKVELRKMEDRIEFFTQNFFHNMPRNIIMKYCYNFEKSKLQKDQILYRQNDQPKNVYLIKKGEIKFVKFINNKQEKNLMVQQNRNYNLDTFIISNGQIFGEIEILLNKKREYTTKCHSLKATVWFLGLDIFTRLLKDNPNLRNQFLHQSKFKESWEKNHKDLVVAKTEKVVEPKKLNLNDIQDPEITDLISGKGLESIKDSIKLKKFIQKKIDPYPENQIYARPRVLHIERLRNTQNQRSKVPIQSTNLMEKLKKTIQECDSDRNRCQSQEKEVFLKNGYKTHRTQNTSMDDQVKTRCTSSNRTYVSTKHNQFRFKVSQPSRVSSVYESL